MASKRNDDVEVVDKNELNEQPQEQKKEDHRLKNTIKNLTIILLIIIIIILLLRSCSGGPGVPDEPVQQQQTAVIADKPVPVENNAIDSGMVRITVNPYVDIKHKTMQNLELLNKNEDVDLTLTIRSVDGETTFYKSPVVKPGERVIGDVFDVSLLSEPITNVIGEFRFYLEDGSVYNQTNVNMELRLDPDQGIPKQ